MFIELQISISLQDWNNDAENSGLLWQKLITFKIITENQTQSFKILKFLSNL